MATSRTYQQTELHDGRMLGYAEYGAPKGKPVFYFHGFPGSRLDYTLFNAGDIAMEMNVRIIAVDRPGMGLSAWQRGRTILDWPDDVVELADTLQLDRFAVLGISGGGPYATACAFTIPERLTATGIACGMGPSDAPGMKEGTSWTIPGKPSVFRRLLLLLMAMGLRRDPDQFTARSMDVFSDPDRQLLDKPEMAQMYVATLLEAFRTGTGGALQDAALYPRPWGFRLQDISAAVHLWHGESDANVLVAVGRYVADALPNCRAVFMKDEGHFTLPHNHIREILKVLAD